MRLDNLFDVQARAVIITNRCAQGNDVRHGLLDRHRRLQESLLGLRVVHFAEVEASILLVLVCWQGEPLDDLRLPIVIGWFIVLRIAYLLARRVGEHGLSVLRYNIGGPLSVRPQARLRRDFLAHIRPEQRQFLRELTGHPLRRRDLVYVFGRLLCWLVRHVGQGILLPALRHRRHLHCLLRPHLLDAED